MASPIKLLKEAGLVRHYLIIFALMTAAFNGLVTASIGSWLAQTYSSHQSRRQYVQNVADLIYERHTRARLVLSSVRRNADVEEIRHRKRAYDEVYVEWNKKIQNNVLPIREAMGSAETNGLETLLQKLLVPAMAELDNCLTKIYDLRLAGLDHAALLDQCQAPELSQFILNCGSGITDELFRFTRLTFLPFRGASTRDMDAARERVNAACTRLPPGSLPSVIRQPAVNGAPALPGSPALSIGD